MSMILSDRYELMPDNFQSIIKKTNLNLELYMDLYLNCLKIPKNSSGWEKMLSIID
jgi:hypothetical protein